MDECHIGLWAHPMNFKWISRFVNELCSSYILQNVPVLKPLQICLRTCARERKMELSLHAHAFEDLMVFVHYQLPYISNSNWMRLELAFLLLLFTTVLFNHIKHVARSDLSELHNVPLFHLGWFVRLSFDVIKS